MNVEDPGLKRDFQTPRPSVKVALNCWFNSRTRNYLQANSSLACFFEIRTGSRSRSGRRSWGGQRPSLAPYVTVTGPKEGAIASGGHGPQGNPIQFPDSHSIPTSIPSEFPRIDISGRALGQDEMDVAIQTTSTSKVRRVDFGGCGPPQPSAGKQPPDPSVLRRPAPRALRGAAAARARLGDSCPRPRRLSSTS